MEQQKAFTAPQAEALATEDRRTCRCCLADVKAGQRPRNKIGELWAVDPA